MPTRRRKRTAVSLTVLSVLLTAAALPLSACKTEKTSRDPRPANAPAISDAPSRSLPSRADRAPEEGRPGLMPHASP